MKIYTKTIDNRQVVKPANKIIVYSTTIIKDNEGNDKEIKMQTINPTEEMILADGWVEHVIPVQEPTEEELLNEAKERLIERILKHDSSDEVNVFYIHEQKM